jgi:hypothetical protein
MKESNSQAFIVVGNQEASRRASGDGNLPEEEGHRQGCLWAEMIAEGHKRRPPPLSCNRW